MEMIPVVDEQDNVIGYKQRGEVTVKDIIRGTGLIIMDGKGKILLAKRAINKGNNPGKWGVSVSGTVEKGETYEENIVKEAREELGLDIGSPTPWLKARRKTEILDIFSQWYLLRLELNPKELTLQEEEVADVRWFSYPELKSAIEHSPDNFMQGIKKLAQEEPEYCKVVFGDNYLETQSL